MGGVILRCSVLAGRDGGVFRGLKERQGVNDVREKFKKKKNS